MKLVILAGGYGTRISEETKIKPKPLVLIGNKPIIWHLMKIYSFYGIKDFIICLGYKGHMLKQELIKYKNKEKWKIEFVNTGLHTMTGGRIKRIKKYLKNEKNFCLSYGDGLSNVNIKKLIKFHLINKKMATLTAVKYRNPKGVLSIKIFKHLRNDKSIFEKDCLPFITRKSQLLAFKHNGFWACMDTLREKKELNTMWKQKTCKWKIW